MPVDEYSVVVIQDLTWDIEPLSVRMAYKFQKLKSIKSVSPANN